MSEKRTDESARHEGPVFDRPVSRRKAAIRIGAVVLGVVLPLVVTLSPTEARAQGTEGS